MPRIRERQENLHDSLELVFGTLTSLLQFMKTLTDVTRYIVLWKFQTFLQCIVLTKKQYTETHSVVLFYTLPERSQQLPLASIEIPLL